MMKSNVSSKIRCVSNAVIKWSNEGGRLSSKVITTCVIVFVHLDAEKFAPYKQDVGQSFGLMNAEARLPSHSPQKL